MTTIKDILVNLVHDIELTKLIGADKETDSIEAISMQEQALERACKRIWKELDKEH